jgi:hypothetical protein
MRRKVRVKRRVGLSPPRKVFLIVFLLASKLEMLT